MGSEKHENVQIETPCQNALGLCSALRLQLNIVRNGFNIGPIVSEPEFEDQIFSVG